MVNRTGIENIIHCQKTLCFGSGCVIFSVNGPAEINESNKERSESRVAYSLDDVPPWYLSMALGLQHYLTMFGGTITYPYLLSPFLCIPDTNPARGYLVTTTFFVSGICTFLQTTFGVRLPIVQGGSMAFFVPILAILSLPEAKCPDVKNMTLLSIEEQDAIWTIRMREVQGAIVGAAIFEVVIGCTGLIGILLTWITPLAIVPTVSLVGLSLFAEAANLAAGHWGIAAFTIALLILFSQYLPNTTAPFPKFTKKDGWTIYRFPVFKLFPVLLTIVLSWALCAVLTVTGVFSEESAARTDTHLTILRESPWFRFPYPGQWGLPTFNTAAIFGVLAGALCSAIESVGDYYACARLADAPSPPKHAINRGIFMEGIGCIISGLFGTGSGVTSYSENIGAIGITKVASRRVVQYGSLLMIAFGMLGKFGALFMTIPQPIIGGVFCIMFSMISAVGLSTLHFVDLNSSRNIFVLGFSIFMGLCVPKWMQANPDVINTGSPVFNQIATVLLSTNMLVGGFIGFLLDNTMPGTDEERGILKWKNQAPTSPETNGKARSYDIPFFKTENLFSFFKYLPVSPSYEENIFTSKILQLKCCTNEEKSRSSSHL
ncbi:solute carrier family 23 member 2-like [Uloborus diversus]|uniref:solute carrier family 23 member 2-like n=1 Tax=Uloborus diversus TaxID=327109 RepID=UPI0024093536|nr:solute carrier family 23 member 2-like [Uloborus diversus]